MCLSRTHNNFSTIKVSAIQVSAGWDATVSREIWCYLKIVLFAWFGSLYWCSWYFEYIKSEHVLISATFDCQQTVFCLFRVYVGWRDWRMLCLALLLLTAPSSWLRISEIESTRRQTQTMADEFYIRCAPHTDLHRHSLTIFSFSHTHSKSHTNTQLPTISIFNILFALPKFLLCTSKYNVSTLLLFSLLFLWTLDPIQFRFSWFILLIQFIWYLFSEHSQWKFIIKVTPNISIQRVCDTKFLLASAHKLHFSFYFWFSVSRTQHSFICKYRKFYRVATHSK